ncbi:MAG: pyrroline-5-carboxylate reductase [Rhodobiaceae bacterium]|nr:pyrroline-5-carboxylate reductase [Rhodobiaceae bacterium]MCC0053459.1 pyrroline-5-carboxylate reductase [Rhodobiaceae bacterium]
MSLQSVGTVLLVGAGQMGGAMLEGWLAGGLPGSQVTVRDPGPPERMAALIAREGIALNPATRGGDPDICIVAVKPQVIDAVLPEVAPLVGPKTLIVSVVAGPTLSRLGGYFSAGQPVVRVMPNTPSAVGRGMSVLCANAHASDAQVAATRALMSAIGAVAEIADEAQMDAVTAVSGSGPAYVFLLAEVLAAAGKKAGLPAELAATLARQTVAGAGELLYRSDLDPATLRKNVTSPNGTTAAALGVLMGEPGMAELLEKAVAAAAKRSRELAG